LHDDDGAVAVPGFYDSVESIAGADREALARIPFEEETYRAEVGVPGLHGEPGFTTLERLWTRPTLEVNGGEAGGWFTVIPRRARAHITCRLVPRQDPAIVFAAIERHVQESRPPGVEVGVEAAPGGVPAYAIPADHPAVRRGDGRASCRLPGERASTRQDRRHPCPQATLFEEILGLKTLLFSFSTADEGLHAPDEFFRLRRLDEGLRAWAELWRLLALDVTPNRLE
jgi:Acetylornithine deacetylase/Succinyl-diaminopimelate desuccinylase and related deacylases